MAFRSKIAWALLSSTLCLLGCNSQIKNYVQILGTKSVTATPTPTPTPTPSNILYTVSISYPASGKITGWLLRVEGTCSGNGIPVSVRDSNSLALSVVTCASNTWKVYLDTSALSLGTQTIIATQTDTQGKTSLQATLQVNKSNSNCDLPANRAKNLVAGLAGGTGTVSDPYSICTADQLQQLSGGSYSYSYQLQNDIDFDHQDSNGDGVVDGADTDYVSGLGWTSFNFSGDGTSVFYGRYFEIRGLTVNDPGFTTKASLFSLATNRIIRNLSVLNVNLSGTDAGAVISTTKASILYDVHASGTVTSLSGGNHAGGLASNGALAVVRSSFEGSVSSASGSAGGLIGSGTLALAAVTDSYMKGTVTGVNNVGGLIGSTASTVFGMVANSYMTGTVTGTSSVGGLIGANGTIVNSHSTADIKQTGAANNYFGGLNGSGATIKNSFFTGTVVAGISGNYGTLSGGFSTITNSYYWSGGACTGSGGGCVIGGTGRASLASFQDTAQAPLSSWDWASTTADGYEDHWLISGASYPQTWWELGTSFTAPFTGAGTTASPYLISSASDLSKIGGNTRWMDANFSLTANIDMTAVASYTPIGFRSAYMGTFDGANFTISNLTYSSAAEDRVGLFSSIVMGQVKNLSLSNINITGQNGVGTLAGLAQTVSYTRVSALSGSVNGGNFSGGLVGLATNEHTLPASGLSANVTVTATGSQVGGLFGAAKYMGLSNSFATGSVTGTTSVGGLVGYRAYWTVDKCYSTGSVTGTSAVGGLVGTQLASGASITNSFSVSAVSGNSAASDVGQIVGTVTDVTTVTTDYVSAAGVSYVNSGGGGVNTIGVNTQATTSAFWNPATAPLSLGWDFSTIWNSRLGMSQYPNLQ